MTHYMRRGQCWSQQLVIAYRLKALVTWLLLASTATYCGKQCVHPVMWWQHPFDWWCLSMTNKHCQPNHSLPLQQCLRPLHWRTAQVQQCTCGEFGGHNHQHSLATNIRYYELGWRVPSKSIRRRWPSFIQHAIWEITASSEGQISHANASTVANVNIIAAIGTSGGLPHL